MEHVVRSHWCVQCVYCSVEAGLGRVVCTKWGMPGRVRRLWPWNVRLSRSVLQPERPLWYTHTRTHTESLRAYMFINTLCATGALRPIGLRFERRWIILGHLIYRLHHFRRKMNAIIVWYDTVYLRTFKNWPERQLSLAHRPIHPSLFPLLFYNSAHPQLASLPASTVH